MSEKEDTKKADVVLSDGREVRFDFTGLKVREWRALFDSSQNRADEDATIAKCALGIDANEIEELEYLDWRKLLRGFYRAASAPLDDPN